MKHIEDPRWQQLEQDDLSELEAEHLASCSACEARWAQNSVVVWSVALNRLQPPPELHGATLARYDLARHDSARHALARHELARQDSARHGLARNARSEPSSARRSAVLIGCALVNALALLSWALLSGAAGPWFVARVSVAFAHVVTLLGVVGRLALHFPLTASVHVTALALCAVLLAAFWAQVARPYRLNAPK